MVRVVPGVVQVVRRVVRVDLELFESFWEMFKLSWELFAEYRVLVNRAKSAAIDFDTRPIVFFHADQGHVDSLLRAPCDHEDLGHQQSTRQALFARTEPMMVNCDLCIAKSSSAVDRCLTMWPSSRLTS